MRNLVLPDLDDGSPNLIEVETGTDLAALLLQPIGSLFSVIANLITSRLNTGQQEDEYKKKYEELRKQYESFRKWVLVGGAGLGVMVVVLMLRR